MLQWTFAQRQIMLLLLGSTGWLVAATLTAGLLEMPGSLNGQLYWFAVAMCLLNIAAYLFNGWHLYVNCVREPARWQADNYDWRSWLAVSVCHVSALALIYLLPAREAELTLLAPFAVIVAPFLNRFTPPVAIATMLLNTAGVALAAPTITGGEVVLVLLVQLALWLLGLGGILELRDKQQLQAALAQLGTTQSLLSAVVADSERQRIARDLHDRMGHHLVALNLQLQLAERGALPPNQPPPLKLARELVAELFVDVRETVSSLREPPQFNFGVALQTMLARISALQVDISGELPAHIDNYQVADCLLRCIQEAITNSLKHSNATRMALQFAQQDGTCRLTLRDNGSKRRRSKWSSGAGLTGMRQRVTELHGNVEWRNSGGFEIDIRLPLPASV